MTRRAPLLRTVLGLAVALLGAAQAKAQAPSSARPQTRHAAVLIDAAPEVDAFTKMYLYEVISGQLQTHGFAVTAADPGASPRPALDCVAAVSCRRAIMDELNAPWLIAVRMQPSGPGRLRVALRTSDGAVTLDVEDEESVVATALDRALAAIDPARVPCLVVLDSDVSGAQFQLGGDDAALPLLVPSGEHDARLEAPDRDAWEGPLVCGGGRVLRVHVR